MISMDDPVTLVIVAATMIVAGFVKGVVGLGLPLVVVGVLSNFLPITSVLALLIAPLMLANIWQVVEVRGNLEPLRRFWPLVSTMMAGLAVGAMMLVNLDAAWLYLSVGVIVTVFTGLGFLRPTMRLPDRYEKPAGFAIGGLAGICGGLGGVWGPPITMYLLALDLKKDEFIGTVGLLWFLGAFPLAALYALNGIIGPHNIMFSVMACFPAIAGLWVGQKVRRRIPQESFKKVLLATLFVIGLNLIRRSFS